MPWLRSQRQLVLFMKHIWQNGFYRAKESLKWVRTVGCVAVAPESGGYWRWRKKSKGCEFSTGSGDKAREASLMLHLSLFWANKKPNKNCRDLLNYFFKQNVSTLHSQLYSGDILALFTQHKFSHRMQHFSCGSAFYMVTMRWLHWNIWEPVPEWNAAPLPAV